MDLIKSLNGKWELYYYDASEGKEKTLADIESGELNKIAEKYGLVDGIEAAAAVR